MKRICSWRRPAIRVASFWRWAGYGFLAAAIPFLMLGCATSPRNLTIDPIGPAPSDRALPGDQGKLVVFSAFDPAPDFNQSPYRRRYTDYKILSADGKGLVQAVHNDREVLASGPRDVGLSPGRYQVLARANGYGIVRVPLLIRSGETTIVHLEGSVWWPRSSAIFQSNPVRLPGGEIAGWRADTQVVP